MLIDSHCHLNFISFKEDADRVISDFLADNNALIVVGSQDTSSVRSIEYAEKHPSGVYASVGLHPIQLIDESEEVFFVDGQSQTFKNRQEDFDRDKYRQMVLSSKKVVALGEIGLDYFYFDKFDKAKWPEFKKIQTEALVGFIDLGEELDKPLILHCRGTKDDSYTAYDDLYFILKTQIQLGKKIRGVIHCFGGNERQAKEFLELGFYLGFTGIITFKRKAEEMQAIAKATPLSKMLIETDAPFLSPEPHRGERCLPQYVEFVAKKIAELKTISYEEVADATTENAKKLFDFPL
ncbi:MAG: TatD family hydrolase [bacterium]